MMRCACLAAALSMRVSTKEQRPRTAFSPRQLEFRHRHRSSAALLDVVLLEQVAKLAEAQAEELGGVLLDAIGAAQRFHDVFALDVLDVLLEIEPAVERQIFRRLCGGDRG